MAQDNFVQRVTFEEEASRGSIPISQWNTSSKHNEENQEELQIESRAFRHAHILRRPHAMQHRNSSEPSSSAASQMTRTQSGSSGGMRDERSTDNVLVQLARVDLFIDLIWVGIVANLSGTYGEQSFTDSGIGVGTATLEYILLFMPVWRLWDCLRDFGSNFYNDDVLQRLFMVWILLLCVLYGINAPYAFAPEDENSLALLIAIYLIARASFLVSWAIQAIFLPFLRRQVLVQIILTSCTSAFWVAAIYVHYPAKIALLVLANAAEHPIAIYLASPYSNWLLAGGWEKKPDIEHLVERFEGFFIIILGEGVFRLIEGSPSGIGINYRTGTVLTALLLYYVLHWIYFNADQSKEFVHALRRTWWKGFIWRVAHLVLFAFLLILAASVLFIVEHPYTTSTSNGDQPVITNPNSEPELTHYTHYALWSASISLAISLTAMTVIALLNLPLDRPKTLIINSRWIRLAPRIPALAVICCLPLSEHLSGAGWCGGVTTTLYAVFLWEWIAGMERNWKLLEPIAESEN